MISDFIWKVYSQLVYKRKFGELGDRSWLRAPLALSNTNAMRLGRGVFIRDGARLQVVHRPGLPEGRLTIGNNVSIEQHAHIIACDEVVIEDEVTIGPRCTIIEATHPIGSPEEGSRVAFVSPERSLIRIGRRAFLGANVVIMPNVTVGENSVIGANSVVTRDIPANSIAVGIPAKVIKSISGT